MLHIIAGVGHVQKTFFGHSPPSGYWWQEGHPTVKAVIYICRFNSDVATPIGISWKKKNVRARIYSILIYILFES